VIAGALLLLQAGRVVGAASEPDAAPRAGGDEAEVVTVQPSWVLSQDGLRFGEEDGPFRLRIGGTIMADYMTGSADSGVESVVGSIDPGAELRRLRVYGTASFSDTVKLRFQVGFDDFDVEVLDLYVTFERLLPFARLNVGYFKEPFNLEELTSGRYSTFMERALPNVFAPSRNSGVRLSDDFLGGRATWAAGLFAETDDFYDSFGEDGWAVTGRVTALPWYEDEGRKLLHVGLAGSLRDVDSVGYSARPEANQAPTFLATGMLATDSVVLGGLEVALVNGPFSLQGEVMASRVDLQVGSDADLFGAYLQASYFLTGEHRPYSRSSGVFGQVRPKRSFDGKGNWGAWEVAARCSYLDFDDPAVDAGTLHDLTLGLNWYLNPNVRVMWNYIHSVLDTNAVDDGDADFLMMRVQVDF
jgi:phosphate-selective porin OprO/OprP